MLNCAFFIICLLVLLVSLHSLRVTLISYPLGCLSMCADDESSSITDRPVLIFLSVPIILLLLAMAIVIIIIIRLRRKKGKKHLVQVDCEEHIYDKPHFLLDTGSSGDVKYVKPNIAYGKAKISGIGSDDVKYVKSNVAYGVSMH